MKNNLLFALLLFWGIILGGKAEEVRRTESLNREWKYAPGDERQAAFTDFDDSHWAVVGLPHSFSIPYFMSKDFYVGYGWYRKFVKMAPEDLQKEIFLEFDGVFQETEVYVNGHLAGQHTGGYTGFSIPLSPYLHPGNNLLAVRVNNLWQPTVAPRAGEHVFSGGIYRSVRLVYKAPVCIDWYGVAIQTPDLGKNQGKSSTVRIQTEVVNHTPQAGHYRLQTLLLNAEGKTIAQLTTDSLLPAQSKVCFHQESQPIAKPELWSPESPTLYTVVSRLYRKNRLLDENKENFGFRWFEWTADKGFFLNGNSYDIHGANVHQDQAGWGDAVTESAMRRDVCQMKEAGFNFIRGSHYPHAPAFVTACDQTGMLFWSEAPFWGIGGFKPDGYWDASAYPVDPAHEEAFEASALQQLAEMIRIHRNHPSIIVWSLCNEPFFSAPSTLPGVKRLLKRMNDKAHEWDASRPVAVGGAQRPLGSDRIDKLADIAGYNGDGATQMDFQQPGIPSMVSEYGSVTSDRPGLYAPGWGDLAHQEAWKGVPWRCGQAIWCGFDHGSIAGSALGKMGIVDYFRIPKRSWYWYRQFYRQIPPPAAWPAPGKPARLVLEQEGNGPFRADGTEDVFLKVTVTDEKGTPLSNSPVVELKVQAGPGEFPTGKSIVFHPDSDIRIQDGQAAIAFRSYYAGTTVIEASSPGLTAHRVTLHFTDAPAYRPGHSPETLSRPYVPYVRPQTEPTVQTFGPNNPTFASSSAPAHDAGQATDNRTATCWKAHPSDPAPWLMVDTEKKLDVQALHIAFAQPLHTPCEVQVSTDQQNWQTLTRWKGTSTTLTPIWQASGHPGKTEARFVRICFPHPQTAAIREIQIKGIVLD